jgi:hypothetical protein
VGGIVRELTIIESLGALERITEYLPDEMLVTLREMLGIYISMKSQRLIGVTPVTTSYERLPPLFYYLSGNESLYYTINDTLIDTKSTTLDEETRYNIKEKLEYLEDELRNGRSNTTLKNQIRILQEQLNSYIYTRGTLNEITHRSLPTLDLPQRAKLFGSLAKSSIEECCMRYNAIVARPIDPEELQTIEDSIFAPTLNPFFNYYMSISQTFTRVRDHRVVSGRKDTRLCRFDMLQAENEENRSLLSELLSVRTKKDEDIRKKEKRTKDIENATAKIHELAKLFSNQREALLPETLEEAQRPRSAWTSQTD